MTYHTKKTQGMVEAAERGDTEEQTKMYTKLKKNAQEWADRIVGLTGHPHDGTELVGLLTEHLVAAILYASSNLSCKCPKKPGACLQADTVTFTFNALVANQKLVVAFFGRILGPAAAALVNHHWSIHLDCTSKYILQIAKIHCDDRLEDEEEMEKEYKRMKKECVEKASAFGKAIDDFLKK